MGLLCNTGLEVKQLILIYSQSQMHLLSPSIKHENIKAHTYGAVRKYGTRTVCTLAPLEKDSHFNMHCFFCIFTVPLVPAVARTRRLDS